MFSSTLSYVDAILSERGKNDKFAKCESASLRLEKYVTIGDNSKKSQLEAVTGRRYRQVPEFTPRGACSFRASLQGRLIVNQANGVLENAGLCLHPHFNSPCIPGSALKGVARHAAWIEWNEESDDARKKTIAKDIASTFGYPTGDESLDNYLAKIGIKEKSSGKVCFMPAYPVSTARLVVDIVNCHHKEYYGGKREEAHDNESPIPNFFLAVEKGCKFEFKLVPLRDGNVELAKEWLIRGITTNGVGAKTAAGYGWFDYDKNEEEERIRREKEADEKKRKEAEQAKREAEEKERRERRAKMTLEERWNELNLRAICNGPEIKNFAKNTDVVKKLEIVKLLQSSDPNSIGYKVWDALLHNKKLKNQPVTDCIRRFARANNLGEEPQ